MPSDQPTSESDRRVVAHIGPFVVFLLLLGLLDLLAAVGFTVDGDGAWYRTHPRQWLYPLQTVVGMGALAFWWRHYDFQPHRGWLFAIFAGLLGIAAWILPGYLFTSWQLPDGWYRYLGFAARDDGFVPSAVFDKGTWEYGVVVAFRFVRMVVVVSLVEEIFWRGFLMRFLVDMDGDYWKVPFGSFHRNSLLIVTGLFVLIHNPEDYLGALIYGLLTYFVAVKTKSLSACVLMHATANLVLGMYVMATEQWGYW